MAIRFFDMFAGIGGFRSGLEAVGGFECIGHCEIDKHANQAYNASIKSIYRNPYKPLFFIIWDYDLCFHSISMPVHRLTPPTRKHP